MLLLFFFINKTGKLLEELNNSSDMLLEENNQIQDGNRKPVFHLAYFCFLFIWGYFSRHQLQEVFELGSVFFRCFCGFGSASVCLFRLAYTPKQTDVR